MPSRIVLAGLALALTAGCSTISGGKSPSGPRSPGNARTGAEAADYSASAVKARTEAHARYAAAILHEQNEEFELAAEEYYRAALADPSNEELVLEVAGRLLRFRPSEKPEDKTAELRHKVVELLKKASADPDASGLVFARLGLAYSLVGKKDLAIDANRQAIKRMPGSLSGYQYLAQIYLQGGQLDDGLKVLDEAARQPNVDAAFLIDLGETYRAFGSAGATNAVRERALEIFKRAAARKPTNPVQLQRLADAFSALGATDQALATYQQLLERLPNLTVVRNKLVELYLRKQDRTNAVVQLRALLREAPADPQSHYLLGSLLFEDKQPKEAVESFRRTILLSPNFEPAYYDLAAAQMNSDAAKEALETLEKARGKFQQSFIGEYYTALAYTRLKDYTNSLKFLTTAEVIARVSATNRLNQGFYFQLGAACERNQQFKEAESHFRKAIELAPDFAEALNYLGYMWAEREENLAEAKEMIEKAVKLEPKNAAFLDSLGWVLFKLGKTGEALPHILKAIELNEEPDATLYDHLGDIRAALKQPEQARDAWRKSLSIEANEKVEKKLKAADAPQESSR
jgi:tetratricopeptide (TPR) repeat protein